MYQSYCRQDQFVDLILGKIEKGHYVDIGCQDPREANNTHYFSSRGWSGLCVEIQNDWNEMYLTRPNCTFINDDALCVDYKSVFSENNFPDVIDYLSLDIDEQSLGALKLMPFDEYKFKVITIEHDFYLNGHIYRDSQREVLISKGYYLLCSDVYVEQWGWNKPECSFEDWWVHPDFFDNETLTRIKSEFCYPSQIIHKFNY